MEESFDRYGTQPTPVKGVYAAPYAGDPRWQQVLDGVTMASGDPSKLVLGIPLYGYNWPIATSGVKPSPFSITVSSPI